MSAVERIEAHPAHVAVGGKAAAEELVNVAGAHRAEGHLEARAPLHLVGRHAGRAQLRHDDPAVIHPLGQSRRLYLGNELVRAEGALARRAPDIDAAGVEHQDPGVQPGQGRAQDVEAQLVIGTREYGRGRSRVSQRVQPGRYRVFVAPDPETHPDRAQPVAESHD
jgi:hypothetical protein